MVYCQIHAPATLPNYVHMLVFLAPLFHRILVNNFVYLFLF